MFLQFFSSIAMAQEAASGAATAAKPSILDSMLPFAAVFFIFYFLIIRPQQKKFKKQQSLISELKRGDEVITSSGILGKIEGITDQYVTLNIADQVNIRILKTQISQNIKQQEAKK